MPTQPTVQEQVAMYIERDWYVPPELAQRLLSEVAAARGPHAAGTAECAAQEWLTTEQAAAYLGTTPKALLRHIARGNLTPDSWGTRGRMRSHRFSRSALDAFVAGSSRLRGG